MPDNTNLTVTFVDEDVTLAAETLALDSEISLILDSEKNNEETSFAVGSDAFVKVLPSGDNTDIFDVNIGEVHKIMTNIPWVITDEEVRFAYASTGNLTYKPSGIVNYSWIGRDGGNPKFNGRNITLNESVVAVLRCTYTTYFDRLRVTYSGSTDENILLVGRRNSSKSSLSISFVSDGVSGAQKDVTITVKDYCNDNVVPYATVIVWGTDFPRSTKTANSSGQVTFDDLTVGTTYNLIVTAPNYKSSLADSLDNASFTVS